MQITLYWIYIHPSKTHAIFRCEYLLLFASRARGGKRHSFSPVAPVCYRPTRLCQLLLMEFFLGLRLADSMHA